MLVVSIHLRTMNTRGNVASLTEDLNINFNRHTWLVATRLGSVFLSVSSMKAETTQAEGDMTTYSVLTAVSTTLKNLISFVKIDHIVSSPYSF